MNDGLLGYVNEAISQSKLDAQLNQPQLCLDFIDVSGCPHIDYSPWMIAYHQEYLSFADSQAQAFTLLLSSNGQPCGILPLMVRNFPEAPELGSSSSDLLPPYLLETLSRKQQRKLSKKCLEFYLVLANRLQISQIRSQFMFVPGMSETWYALLVDQGGVPQYSQELFCNLQLSAEDYWTAIRDKYRSHIARAERLWRVEVKSDISDEDFGQFQQLHLTVVGHKTRSDLSWGLLKQAVDNHNAFAVFAYNDHDELIGGGLFTYTSQMAYYSVGVYDRNLFAQPVSHIVHFKAITQMKALGLRKYHLGARCNKHEWMNPSDKEWQIGHFKEGFSTESLFKVRVTVNVDLVVESESPQRYLEAK